MIKQDLIFRNGIRNWLNPEVIFFLHICAVMFEYHSGRSGCANKTSLQPIYLQQSMSRIPTMSQRLDQEWESECVMCNWALIWQLFSSFGNYFQLSQLALFLALQTKWLVDGPIQRCKLFVYLGLLLYCKEYTVCWPAAIVYFSLKNKIAVLCGWSTIQGNDSPRLINHSPNTNSQISFCHTLTFAVFLCFLFLKYLQYFGTQYQPNGDSPSNYLAGTKGKFSTHSQLKPNFVCRGGKP